jgi:hypothetical protein
LSLPFRDLVGWRRGWRGKNVGSLCQILSKQDDFVKYSKLAAGAAVAYNKRFYDPVGKTYVCDETHGNTIPPALSELDGPDIG